MSEDFSLDQIVANVRAAASDCGAMIVEAIVSLGSIAIPVAEVTIVIRRAKLAQTQI